MSFIWPPLLWLLTLAPLGGLVYMRVQRRRRQAAAQYGQLGLGPTAAAQRLGWRRHLPAALFLAGLTMLLFALARPQMAVSLPRVEGTVILTFDVSGSMAATDLQPTRMEAAKAAARAFVERQPANVLIGVVAFSDGGLAVQAPTNDTNEVLAAIARLTPQRGTSLAQGMQAALNTLAAMNDETGLLSDDTRPTPLPTIVPPGSNGAAAIILLTDGENNVPPDPLEAAQAAANAGVRVYTVGVGSPAGVNLDLDGFSVFTQLNEPVLQQIAQVTEGAYYNAASAADLESIYSGLDLHLVVRPEDTELTALFAGLGGLALLAGGGLSLAWFGRMP
ncbi:MAG: VWA domain-containing protein [Anaerolineales bacterium]|nr:VWA domain-containing protein [Anaerolineales bacterium]